jgi:hypothetical protein
MNIVTNPRNYPRKCRCTKCRCKGQRDDPELPRNRNHQITHASIVATIHLHGFIIATMPTSTTRHDMIPTDRILVMREFLLLIPSSPDITGSLKHIDCC